MGLVTITNSIVDGLKKHEVIPEVIEDFSPAGLLTISYGQDLDVAVGNTLKPSDTQEKPEIQFTLNSKGKSLSSGDTFTLVMTDPDAPSRTEKKWSEYCHYIVSGLKLPSVAAAVEEASTEEDVMASDKLDLNSGIELVPYMGPGPPPHTKKHRYVFILFKENKPLTKADAPSDRPTWGTNVPGSGVKEWALKHNLTPLAINFFFAQNDEN